MIVRTFKSHLQTRSLSTCSVVDMPQTNTHTRSTNFLFCVYLPLSFSSPPGDWHGLLTCLVF